MGERQNQWPRKVHESLRDGKKLGSYEIQIGNQRDGIDSEIKETRQGLSHSVYESGFAVMR